MMIFIVLFENNQLVMTFNLKQISHSNSINMTEMKQFDLNLIAYSTELRIRII